jgi:hypothetical protein
VLFWLAVRVGLGVTDGVAEPVPEDDGVARWLDDMDEVRLDVGVAVNSNDVVWEDVREPVIVHEEDCVELAVEPWEAVSVELLVALWL